MSDYSALRNLSVRPRQVLRVGHSSPDGQVKAMPEQAEVRRSDSLLPPTRDADRLVACAALAGWIGCAAVGVAGLRLSYGQPVLPLEPPREMVAVQNLNVELTSDDDAVPSDGPPPSAEERDAGPAVAAEPLPPPEPAPLPTSERPLRGPAPPLVEVVEPKPLVAFPVPLEGPARVAEEGNPAPPAEPTPAARPSTGTVTPSTSSAADRAAGERQPRRGATEAGGAETPGPAQRLTLGVGEGRQPRPEYPEEAIRAGQEGRVVVRFTVGEDGRVAAAEVREPSKWSLLNRAAVRGIQRRWRFARGPVRVYEVNIVYRLDD